MDPMDLLDPELRPIPPQPGCEPSMQIYQDHRKVISLFNLNSNVLEMLYRTLMFLTYDKNKILSVLIENRWQRII